MNKLSNLFPLINTIRSPKKPKYKTEIIGGFTTFLAMVYIIFVNPTILKHAGLEVGAVFLATIIVATLGSLLIGLFVDIPIGMAPGMGLNALFAFTIVLKFHMPLSSALGSCIVSGFLFILIGMSPFRKKIIQNIPMSLKLAIGAGIGLFITLIGFHNSEIIVANKDTLVGLGDISSFHFWISITVLLLSAIFYILKLKGGFIYAMIIGISFGIMDKYVFHSGYANLPEWNGWHYDFGPVFKYASSGWGSIFGFNNTNLIWTDVKAILQYLHFYL